MGQTSEPYGQEFGRLSIVMKLDFAGVDPVPVTRNAWKALRFYNPLIASWTNGLKRNYRIAGEQELDSWLKETFIVHEGSDSYQSAEQLRLGLRPARRAQLHILPQATSCYYT